MAIPTQEPTTRTVEASTRETPPPEREPATDASNVTAGQALSAWWNRRLPPGARSLIKQVAISLAVVLLVLPLASAFGWFGLHNATPAPASNAGHTTMTTNSASPNAPAHETYNPAAPATPQGDTVEVKLVVNETLVSIAPGIAYRAWTFNGTVPGPVIRVRQGQTIHFTLTNSSTMSHSIDFHAAQTPWSVNYQSVAPGRSFSFDWKANYPGVFMYHCGTPPVMVHMANGMYGAIIVDPANGWSAPAHEYVLVQSEFYVHRGSDGMYGLDNSKMMTSMPDYVTFNGYTTQYVHAPLAAKAGERIRLFILNAGPTHFSAFHVIGTIFSDTYTDGNPANHMRGIQTITIPPGGGAIVELTVPEAGQYPFVTHSFMDASSGATGLLDVKP